MHKSAWISLAALVLLLFAVIGTSGCIADLNPTPNEVKIRGNIISIDPQYVTNDMIWVLLFNPNNYEPELFNAVDKYLPYDSPVIEVGCGIGAMSAFINDRIMYPMQQVSLEPNPFLQDGLAKTRELNQLSCTFVEKAVAYGAPVIELQVSNTILSNTIATNHRENTVLVETTTLEDTANEAGFSQNEKITLVLTAVGSEHTILQREPEFFRDRVGCVIAAVYKEGKSDVSTFTQQITKLGFTEKHEVFDAQSGYYVAVYMKETPNTPVPTAAPVKQDESVSSENNSTRPAEN